ncbi:hypothetical protein BN14_06835 [Rhizoctonia solani AG-1 IB]|uniref:Uncharacterized protein n=1 Tax=Thanatephorus cucumeris (strain AG1-IB / isolate 7/3/14) TaxID=1108050 RepID=M5CAB9_THACB|nr:hypothetical protein BN14_06835 [Rhizoctonia solani AG-1 IB]
MSLTSFNPLEGQSTMLIRPDVMLFAFLALVLFCASGPIILDLGLFIVTLIGILKLRGAKGCARTWLGPVVPQICVATGSTSVVEQAIRTARL